MKKVKQPTVNQRLRKAEDRVQRLELVVKHLMRSLITDGPGGIGRHTYHAHIRLLKASPYKVKEQLTMDSHYE